MPEYNWIKVACDHRGTQNWQGYCYACKGTGQRWKQVIEYTEQDKRAASDRWLADQAETAALFDNGEEF